MHTVEKAIYNRTTRLLGLNAMEALSQTHVIIVGVGGVGSWCAEGLVRSGITHLTLVDSDRVCITNVNRQLMATVKTVGQVKVEALKNRLLDINPHADIVAIQQIFSEDNHADFHLADYDYIIDAVDSLKDKVSLILHACQSPAVFFSSMGAALKVDPTQIRVAEFWQVQGCPLAATLRRRFRKLHQFPAHRFYCVYSPEVQPNCGSATTCGTDRCLCPKATQGPGDPTLLNHEWCSTKAQINGTTAHITGIFGLTLSGLVINDVYSRCQKDEALQADTTQ